MEIKNEIRKWIEGNKKRFNDFFCVDDDENNITFNLNKKIKLKYLKLYKKIKNIN